MLLVTAFIIAVLWGCQVLLIGSIYGGMKTAELKEATASVGRVLTADGDVDIDAYELAADDINLRIIALSNFKDIYFSGDGYASATRDIGDFEVLKLYNLALENGGEVSQYYRYDRRREEYMTFRFPKRPPEEERRGTEETEDGEERQDIGVHFVKGRPGLFVINSDRYVDDFLHALIVQTAGEEYMVIADVQVTPLDSTVKVLKIMLELTTVAAVIVALIVSFFMSRSIARPIEKINRTALDMARGKFDAAFSGKGYREIEQLSDTLNYTARELGRVDEFRREMLANVSHDLRTPLTMIGGYAEMMRDIPGENSPENAQVIIDETYRLTGFVNDILDLSKLESGMDESEKKTVRLTGLLESIRARYTGLVGRNGYRIELTADDDAYTVCDENKILQAFNNLMDNAINHTGEDKTVRIRQLCRDGKARVEIRDSGKGIPKEDLPYIWDRYYRGDKVHKRAVIGSGIGLSIVKAIFEQHSLTYGVESEAETGTVFYVEFPLADPPEEEKDTAL